MLKRANKGISWLLVLAMLSTMFTPLFQPSPPRAYAAPGGKQPSDSFAAAELLNNMLKFNATSLPEEDTTDTLSYLGGAAPAAIAQPFTVEFEQPEYSVVRSKGPVLIPVVMSGNVENISEAVWVSWRITDFGTAEPGVDYVKDNAGMLWCAESLDQPNYIAIELTGEGSGEKTIELELFDPGGSIWDSEVLLGSQYKTLVTIRPARDYMAPSDYKYLYNGRNINDTGIENWEGLSRNEEGRGVDEVGVDSYNAIQIPTWWTSGGNTYMQGIQATEAQRMANLTLEWKSLHEGTSYAVVSSKPGSVTGYGRDELPTVSSRVYMVETFKPTPLDPPYQRLSIPLEDKRVEWDYQNPYEGMCVGFYADGGARLELLSVEMEKRQYDIRVTLPRGTILEVKGVAYDHSFNGRFAYDGAETLKATAPGYSLQGWQYLVSPLDCLNDPYGNYPPYTKTLSETESEISIHELFSAMGRDFDFIDSQNLWIQLRPLFSPSLNLIEVQPYPVEGGTATGGGEYLTGSEVNLTALASEGYAFTHWSVAGQADVTQNPWIFTADKPLTVTANFAPGYSITAEASPPEGGTAVIEGTPVEDLPITARATANAGYRFSYWTENGGVVSESAVYVFNAAADRHLVAHFEAVQVEILVRAHPTSGGKVSGAGLYLYGAEVTLTADPYSAYEFVNWTLNGTEVSPEPVFTFNPASEVVSIYTANFHLKPGNFSMIPYRQFTKEPVQFDASMILRDNSGATFEWQFGDGATASGMAVSHGYTDIGTYAVTVTAKKGGAEVLTKTREIAIVEPLPLELSDFEVNPRGIRLVEPGGKTSWMVQFSNNGVPMADKQITVTDELSGDSAGILTDGEGFAFYQTSIPGSAPYGIYTITFRHGPLAAARAVQVYSSSITLSGQVFDNYSGRRLEGAKVTAGGKTVLTDGQGVYAITGLSSGDSTLSVTLDGYRVFSQALQLVSAEAVQNIPLFRIIPGTLPLIGRVYSERSDSSSGVDRFLTYGENRPQVFNVTIDWRGHVPGEVHFILPAGTVTGTLESGGYTASRLIDLDGEIGPGGRLVVQAVTETGVLSVPVDAMLEIVPQPPFDTDALVMDLPNVESMVVAPHLPFVGGSAIGFDFPSVRIETEVKNDGTASMYIGYVVGKKDAKPEDLKDPGMFKEAKDLYNKLQKQKTMVKSKVDYEVIIGGKFVFIYDAQQKEWVFREGWMVITGSGEVTVTAYAMTPILIPVYVQCSFGGALTLYVGHTFYDGPQFEAVLTPELWMSLAAGIGLAGIISAEIFGKVHGQFTVILTEGKFDNWAVTVSCGVRFRVFFFRFQRSITHRWPDQSVQYMIMSLPELGELKPLPRDYLARPSTWLPPQEPRVMLAGNGEGGGRDLRETVIQSNVYPYSDSRLVLTDEGPMLVWVVDNPARSDDNRTEVQYSLFDRTTWSAPRAIDDDGTADFYPQVAGWKESPNDKTVVAAWVNMAKVLDDGAGLDELLSESVVTVAFYDPLTGFWTDVKDFPADGYQDTAPQVCAAGNSALVVWTRSEPPVQTAQEEEPYTNVFTALYPQQSDIIFSRWEDGSWSDPDIAVAGAGSVIQSSLACDGENALLTYIVDLDGNPETVDDRELFYTSFTDGNWSAPVRVTHNDVQDMNPQAVYVNGEPLLFWYQDGQVLYLRGLSGTPSVAVSRPGEGLAGFTLATGENSSLALVWGDGVEEGQEIFASVYDPAHDSWCQPIQLTFTAGAMVNRSIDAALDGEGNILTVFNRAAAVEIVDDTDVTEPTDLVFAILTVGRDLAVEEITLSEENPVPGSLVTLNARLANLGELAEHNVEVAFFEGDPQQGGKQIGSIQVMEGILAAGERRAVTMQWTVPKTLEASHLYVVADPQSKVADRNRDNNTDFISAAKAALEIIEVRSQSVGLEEFLLTATVVNRGVITAKDTNVSLYSSEAGEYGAIRGSLLESSAIGDLIPGQQKEVTLYWKYTQDDFTDGMTFLFLEAVAAAENVPGGANTARVLMRKPIERPVQDFVLNKKTLTLPVGEEYQLEGIFTPPNAANRDIIWVSDNESVAQVDPGGKVSAVEVGTAVITATTLDGRFTDTCHVHVIDDYIEAALNLTPKTLNTKNPVKWVTARLNLPKDYDHRQVNINSIQLQYGGQSIAPEQVDVTGNGLLIKFNGSEVAGLVSATGDYTLTLFCRAEEHFFRAADKISFIAPPAKKQ